MNSLCPNQNNCSVLSSADCTDTCLKAQLQWKFKKHQLEHEDLHTLAQENLFNKSKKFFNHFEFCGQHTASIIQNPCKLTQANIDEWKRYTTIVYNELGGVAKEKYKQLIKLILKEAEYLRDFGKEQG